MNNHKQKVLILTNKIPHYRIELYASLGKQTDLTVAGIDSFDSTNHSFDYIELKHKTVRRFKLTAGLLDLCDNFSVVVIMFDLSWISYMKLLRTKKREFKIILWGIGLSSENGLRHGRSLIIDKVRYYLAKKADALIFYSSIPIKYYVANGIPSSKIFIGRNSIMNDYTFKFGCLRDTILFVGSLNKRKGINKLLESFKLILPSIPDDINLCIIGEGEEYENINNWINKNSLHDRIYLVGGKYGEDLNKHFESAIITVSPNQAGLSVLHSLSFGVPFITSHDAITGGEIENIMNGETGFLYKTDNELSSAMKSFIKNKHDDEFYYNIWEYFNNEAHISCTVSTFINAIEFVVNSK